MFHSNSLLCLLFAGLLLTVFKQLNLTCGYGTLATVFIYTNYNLDKSLKLLVNLTLDSNIMR
jgi:hypothetical protein